jgi:nucleotide-binding universal stress UspA family protein
MKEEDNISAGKEDHPVFHRAIVAIALSPHLPAILNQSSRLLASLGAETILLHVGPDTAAARKKLKAAIETSHYHGDSLPELIIRQGQPVDVIAEVARHHRADLIFAGAARKESLLRHFIGSVAHQLAQKAPCSLLLMTDQDSTPEPVERVHCAVEYDRAAHFTVEVAMGIARRLQSKELVLTHSFRVAEWEGKGRSFPADEEIRRIYRRQDARLQRFLARYKMKGIRYRAQCFYERTFDSTLTFARDVNANLLVIPGPRRHIGIWDRLLKDNIAHLLQSLPDAILLTRKPRYRVHR